MIKLVATLLAASIIIQLQGTQLLIQQIKSNVKTIADLKKEAEINIRTGRCCLGHTKFIGAPSSLLRALESLNVEQTKALNAYHHAITTNEPIDQRAQLARDVELLVRNESERTELLDNLRWLQRDGSISYVQKFTPHLSKFLPFLSVLLPSLVVTLPLKATTLKIFAGLLATPSACLTLFGMQDKKVAHTLREKYRGTEKFTDFKGII